MAAATSSSLQSRISMQPSIENTPVTWALSSRKSMMPVRRCLIRSRMARHSKPHYSLISYSLHRNSTTRSAFSWYRFCSVLQIHIQIRARELGLVKLVVQHATAAHPVGQPQRDGFGTASRFAWKGDGDRELSLRPLRSVTFRGHENPILART